MGGHLVQDPPPSPTLAPSLGAAISCGIRHLCTPTQELKETQREGSPSNTQGLLGSHRPNHQPGGAHGHRGRQEPNPRTLEAQRAVRGLFPGLALQSHSPVPGLTHGSSPERLLEDRVDVWR